MQTPKSLLSGSKAQTSANWSLNSQPFRQKDKRLVARAVKLFQLSTNRVIFFNTETSHVDELPNENNCVRHDLKRKSLLFGRHLGSVPCP